jgi:hypothetical protein
MANIRGICRTVLAAAFGLVVVGPALAEELAPIAGRSIDLGQVHGIAYYTVEPNGYRVVATLAEGEMGTPVRFEAVLAPDQSMILSTPQAVGMMATEVEISRQDDRVLVRETTGVTN